MSFHALRTNAPAPRSDLASSRSDDNAANADDGKATIPSRTRNESRISTVRIPSVVVALEPHWEISIDSATD